MSVEVHMHRHVHSFPNKPLSLAGARFSWFLWLNAFHLVLKHLGAVVKGADLTCSASSRTKPLFFKRNNSWTSTPMKTVVSWRGHLEKQPSILREDWLTTKDSLKKTEKHGKKKQTWTIECFPWVWFQDVETLTVTWWLLFCSPQRYKSSVPKSCWSSVGKKTHRKHQDHTKHITCPTPKNRETSATSPWLLPWRLKPIPVVAPCSVKAANAPSLACSCCTLETWLETRPPEAKCSKIATSHTGEVGVTISPHQGVTNCIYVYIDIYV